MAVYTLNTWSKIKLGCGTKSHHLLYLPLNFLHIRLQSEINFFIVTLFILCFLYFAQSAVLFIELRPTCLSYFNWLSSACTLFVKTNYVSFRQLSTATGKFIFIFNSVVSSVTYHAWFDAQQIFFCQQSDGKTSHNWCEFVFWFSIIRSLVRGFFHYSIHRSAKAWKKLHHFNINASQSEFYLLTF